ncbi:protein JINGUBANG [Cicer arietinum]|uniref:Protein JINGUBANG n=1 Tax=Cicer arietinum TaxID=3827 RepID=A0A1S3E969_CICAR|nr:protein JINGUBANG [Cicer arietinum]
MKMGLLQCPLSCYSQNQQQQTQSHSHDHHLNSESSTSSSLSSQPSLPSVPSLTSQPSQQSHSHDHHLNSESSTSSSLSSQPSLPSVPSLTSQPSQQSQTTHHQLLTTIKGHNSPIFSLTLHSKFLYSASSNSEIRRFNKDPFALEASNNTNNKLVAISNKSTIKSIIILNDMLFSAHQDHKIRVWKIETKTKNSTTNDQDPQSLFKCIATLPTFNDRFSKIFSSKNYVEVRRHKKCTWVNHIDTVSSLAVSKDESLIYSASWDRTFKIWRVSDFKCLESVKNAHEDAINSIVVSSDGVVYTGSADKKIKIWKKNHNHNEIEKSEKKHFLIGTLEKHRSAVNALALNKNGSILYSGACDRSILVWEKSDDEKMVLVGALRGHTKAILCLVVNDDLVCSGSADNSVRIWRRGIDEKNYSCLGVLQGHRKPVKCLAMAANDSKSKSDDDNCNSYLVYSGSLDCDIKVWKIQVPLF